MSDLAVHKTEKVCGTLNMLMRDASYHRSLEVAGDDQVQEGKGKKRCNLFQHF